MNDTVELAKSLIAKPSVTPDDQGCQDILITRLNKQGFKVTHLPFGDVNNFWARRGTRAPLLVFAGHTDVVPPGPIAHWQSDPFQPDVRDGHLFGRGAADMKSSLAAMITACENFIEKNPDHPGSIAFLITSDEEGLATHGTRKVVDYLIDQGVIVDYCIIGEASCDKKFGDTLKNGRRGSLGGTLIIKGTQGHIAYPQLADNPIHHALDFLKTICETTWDNGNEHFPATCFQISNIHAGTGADNVIPGELAIMFNFRYSTEVTAEELQKRFEKILNDHKLNYDISWRHSGNPFLTPPGELTNQLKKAIAEITQVTPQLSTSGGTSDGRFIAKMGCQIVEFGPINDSIHKVNENINIENLLQLSEVYERTLDYLLSNSN